ncbi:TPA: hypothetical protein GDD11_11875 [Legionella pneumophila]|nr:hypothetical protein [Legionella pneumophila]HAT8332587.1 hypothetical protein [Legionella pneumophila]
MRSMSYDNFLVLLAGEMDKLTRHVVFDGYQALANLLKAPLASLIILYMVLKGYALAQGMMERPQQEFFRFGIRVGLIYLFAMNWDFFSSYVRDLFIVGSETIATKLMLSVHKGLGTSINQGLQNVLNEIIKLGCALFEVGSLRKLTPYFAGMMVFLCGSITLALAFIEIIIAKLMLAVTLCTAPLFILFTLFDQTKSFFERWLGILAGFSFVLIFVSSVVGLCIHLLHWVTSSFASTNTEVNAAIWVPIFIVSCLCVLGITQAASIGKGIGGSLCTSGGAAMVGSVISNFSVAGQLMNGFKKLSSGRQGSNHAATQNNQGKQTNSNPSNRFKQLHKNLRRGVS